KLVQLSPAVVGACLMLKARFVTPEEHSGLLAMWSLGPWSCAKAAPWKVELFFKLRELPSKVVTLSKDDLLEKWRSRPTDVVIAVPPKSGTTWLLQIAHQLRMKGAWGGDASFEDQMDVMPMLEGGPASLLPDNDINKEHVADPRVYKSHLRFRSCPDTVKRIYCFRDLKDVIVSDWHFISPIIPSDIPLAEFAVLRVVPGGIDRALYDLCDWWEHRHDPNVCFFFFDDLVDQHLECVSRVQQFMELGDQSQQLAHTVLGQSTHGFMSRPENHSKFDDHKIVAQLDNVRGHTRTVPLSGKVRQGGGSSGAGREVLPEAVQRWIDWRWECIVLKRLGFQSLQAMRD
ncbi:unnamed protein product, partial [Polarella glacialis]